MLRLMSVCSDAGKSKHVVIRFSGVLCTCYDILRVRLASPRRVFVKMLMEMMMPWFLGGQAQVLAVARPDWTYVEKKVESPKDLSLISKVQKPKKSESEVKAEQANWIKQYMAQQAEVIFLSVPDLLSNYGNEWCY